MTNTMTKLFPEFQAVKAKWLNTIIGRYAACREGVAAIEFAFVAPVMIIMYFGLAEIALAISIDRQISHSANVAGDLTTQSAQVSAADMEEIMTATLMVMGIPDSQRNSVIVEVASFSRLADDTVVPRGTATLNGPYPTTFDASTLDTRILSSSSGIVVARVQYTYEPLKLMFFDTNFDLTETFLLKPRKSANVDIQETTGEDTYTCSFVANQPSCVAS